MSSRERTAEADRLAKLMAKHTPKLLSEQQGLHWYPASFTNMVYRRMQKLAVGAAKRAAAAAGKRQTGKRKRSATWDPALED
jgi:threonine aldolase